MIRSTRFNVLGAVVALTALFALVVGSTASASQPAGTSGSLVARAAAKKGLTKAQVLKLIKSQAGTLRGPQGPAGPTGPMGPQGPAGLNGSGGGGTTAQKFACKTNEGQSDPSCGTIYNQDGLRFQSDCSNNGLSVRSMSPNATMTLQGFDTTGSADIVGIAATQINDGWILTPPSNNSSMGVVTYSPIGSATVITVNYSATYWPGAPAGDCVFMGTIVKA